MRMSAALTRTARRRARTRSGNHRLIRDSRIAKMKDKRTHLAYKAEHVVDVESEFVMAASVYTADQSDPATLVDSIWTGCKSIWPWRAASRRLKRCCGGQGLPQGPDAGGLARRATRGPTFPSPRGAPSSETQPRRRQAVKANRRRIQGAKSKRLQKRRSEVVERSFAHVCETGEAAADVASRLGGRWPEAGTRLQAAAHNLALLMRKLFGMGKPRTLQGGAGGIIGIVFWLYWLSTALHRRRYRRVTVGSLAASH